MYTTFVSVILNLSKTSERRGVKTAMYAELLELLLLLMLLLLIIFAER